ncbi:hypothetical protein ACFP2T_27050 [Plantactinospora solaniradicis]|uniref:Uncharacterized protein n=1 Tax=Plantactinospora solaniradicis TaxID=1723736 RepID=A0ABW1KG67_9ACTN
MDSKEPPRRLLLGGDALGLALESGEERLAEARQWAEVSRSTDYPDASASAAAKPVEMTRNI